MLRDCLRFPHIFGPTAPKISLGFSQEFPSSDAILHTLCHIVPTKISLGFHTFSSSDANFLVFSTFLALLHQKSFNFHRIFLF